MTKSEPVVNSQWIDWGYMENKHDPIFDRVIAACQAKHLRDNLLSRKIGTMKQLLNSMPLYALRSMGTQENFTG
jgi:tRNA(His) 5'-end guanylyltransferase